MLHQGVSFPDITHIHAEPRRRNPGLRPGRIGVTGCAVLVPRTLQTTRALVTHGQLPANQGVAVGSAASTLEDGQSSRPIALHLQGSGKAAHGLGITWILPVQSLPDLTRLEPSPTCLEEVGAFDPLSTHIHGAAAKGRQQEYREEQSENRHGGPLEPGYVPETPVFPGPTGNPFDGKAPSGSPSASMHLEALLLDFGGTLATERTSRAGIYALAATRRGLDVDEPAMGRLMSETHARMPELAAGAYRYTDAWFRQFIGSIFRDRLGLPREELAGVEAELFEAFSNPATFTLRPGAMHLVEHARSMGLKTAVVSNWGERLQPLLDGLGLAPHLDTALTSALEGVEKPSPEIFRRALRRLDVPPERALHLGDRWDNDVEGARAAGVEAVFYAPDGTMGKEREGTPVVSMLTDLLELLADPR